MLHGNQILKSLELLEKVELVANNVTNNPLTVKQLSNSPPPAVDTTKKEPGTEQSAPVKDGYLSTMGSNDKIAHDAPFVNLSLITLYLSKLGFIA